MKNFVLIDFARRTLSIYIQMLSSALPTHRYGLPHDSKDGSPPTGALADPFLCAVPTLISGRHILRGVDNTFSLDNGVLTGGGLRLLGLRVRRTNSTAPFATALSPGTAVDPSRICRIGGI